MGVRLVAVLRRGGSAGGSSGGAGSMDSGHVCSMLTPLRVCMHAGTRLTAGG